ncbi:MAG: hypothetical protein Q4A75_01200 [Peptostreptococcaceae bacterium]|nr:hypothetical protein [Peptostreptococcaceae bacterium]
MELLKLKVRHNDFGLGEIIEVNGRYVTIQFTSKLSRFVFPDSFEKYIVAEDEEVQSDIDLEINKRKKLKSQKTHEEKSYTQFQQNIKSVKKEEGENLLEKKFETTSHQSKERRSVFFVFQGRTFDKEFKGGYLWAPISNKSGKKIHHWERMMTVSAGDIILHGSEGYIKAVSVAKGMYYNCDQPSELATENMWEKDGRKIDCDYMGLMKLIKTSDFKDEIIKYSKAKYSPFNKEGAGNMGYLYELNIELAEIFLKAIIKENPYIAQFDYIKNFYKEDQCKR